MARGMAKFQLFWAVALLRVAWSSSVAAGGARACGAPRVPVYHAAENRALAGHVHASRRSPSRVRCARECSMDGRCVSFNYRQRDNLCELNSAAAAGNSSALCHSPGSAYFDGDEGTRLLSLPAGAPPVRRWASCRALLADGHNASGVYTIHPGRICAGDAGVRVYCDMETDGGGWVVLQRRRDGSVDFARDWAGYRAGFGDLRGEFWLGNDNMAALTTADEGSPGAGWELRVDLAGWGNDSEPLWCRYGDFKVSPGLYRLSLGAFDGASTAGDGFGSHDGAPFSTFDRDNDRSTYNCASGRPGGWWFTNCFTCHLNGPYVQGGDTPAYTGIQWAKDFGKTHSLKSTTMQVREKPIDRA